LDLHGLGITSLPSSIGKLIHSRYLNSSQTPIIGLPNSITRLQNLQSLELYDGKPKSLPAGTFKRLTNLRSLDGRETYFPLPSGIGQLASLHKLTHFLVRMHKRGRIQLRDLKNLDNLRGFLMVVFRSALEVPIHEAKEANLGSKHGLEELEMDFDERVDGEALLEGVKPHPNLKMLTIRS